jgi:glutathione-S-conjugate glycine hydrolase
MLTRRRFSAFLAAPLLALALQACATTIEKPAPSKDVAMSGSYVTLISPEGRKRIERSRHRADLIPLLAVFDTQERQTLCSVAAGVTILNALPIKRPIDPKYAPYPYFTQENYFDDRVNKIITREKTLVIGQTLDQAALVMATHGAVTKVYHASDASIDDFRRIAKANLDTPNDYIAVNYRRNHVGQPPGSHFSPLAAYDDATDSFLVLDVARYKFPPVWITTTDLYDAMNTYDSESGKTRGFLVVSAPAAKAN